MFSEDIYTIHGENTIVAASVCDTDRIIIAKYLDERDGESYSDAMDRREFRDFQRMMRGNVGVRL